MKTIIMAVAAAWLALLSQPAMAAHVDDPALVAQGAKIYSENCGRCHNPRPASDYSKTEWSVVMPHMRAKAHLTGTEALAVEAFLDSTLTSDVKNARKDMAKSDEPASAERGEKLVQQFGCQGCHQINGSGGALGPDLTGVVKRKGEDFVVHKLLNPKFNNASSAMPQFPMSRTDAQSIMQFLAKF